MVTDIKSQLYRDEKLVLHAYQDSEGFWTLGVGRLIDQRKGGGISTEEADYLLNNDIKRCTDSILSTLPWTSSLDIVRFSILINMVFNMGMSDLLEFKNMLAALRIHDYESAARQMEESLWQKQVGDRAIRLAQQMRTGQWQ